MNIIYEELSKANNSLVNDTEKNSVPVPISDALDVLLDTLSSVHLVSIEKTYDVDGGFLILSTEESKENGQTFKVNNKFSDEILKNNENIQLLSVVTIPPQSNDITSQLLVYPKPIPKSNTNKTTPKMPSAISSELWRQIEKEKEDENPSIFSISFLLLLLEFCKY